jgi:integrase
MTRGSYSYSRDNWVISTKELKMLIDSARFKQIKILLVILYYTGCRYVEAKRLKINNIIIEEDYITFNIKNAKRKDKSMRQLKIPRSVPYMEMVINFVEDRERRQTAGIADENLFMEFNYRKGIYELELACKNADIPLSFHAFRKSRATAIANSGVNANALAGWLGHKSLNMSVWYVQNSTALTKDITESFKNE